MMKKLLFILLCLPLILFSQSHTKDVVFYEHGFILNNFEDTIFKSVVNENGLIKSIYHYELGGCVDGSWVICPEVEILGWSKQGLVAYVTSNGIHVVEEKICLTIQDLVSDEVLERDCDLNIGDIHPLLHQYGIINQDAKYFSKIPGYNVDLITKSEEVEDCPVQDIQYQINISHSTHGQKNVADGVYHCVNDLGVFGYFKSPFEDRVLIILYYMPFPVEWEPYYITGYGSSLNPSTFK